MILNFSKFIATFSETISAEDVRYWKSSVTIARKSRWKWASTIGTGGFEDWIAVSSIIYGISFSYKISDDISFV